MPYSQPKTIAAISKFYAFLTTLPYIPSSALVYPPPTGWPSIDDDVFAPLGKTPEVLNLLRHLPYFEGGEWRITHDTTVLPYHAPEVGDLLKNGGSMENAGLKPFDSDEIAPHAVYLTGGGDIYATWLICDTVEGNYSVFFGKSLLLLYKGLISSPRYDHRIRSSRRSFLKRPTLA